MHARRAVHGYSNNHSTNDQTSINTSDAQSELNRDSLGSKAKFYYGDWGTVQGHVTSGGLPYDIILTSETIYSVPSQPKLLQALKLLTNQSRGLVVVAVKAHYFGVGGSVPRPGDSRWPLPGRSGQVH